MAKQCRVHAKMLVLFVVALLSLGAGADVSAQEPPEWHVGDWWTLKILTKGPAHEWCEPSFLHYSIVDTTTMPEGPKRHCYRVERFLLEKPDSRDSLPPASWVYYFAKTAPALLLAGPGAGRKGYPCRNQADYFPEDSRQGVSGPHMILIPRFEVKAVDVDTLPDGRPRRLALKPAGEPPFSQVLVDTVSLSFFAGELDDSLDLSRAPAEGYYWIEFIDKETEKPQAIWYWHPDLPWAIYGEFYGRHDRWREPVQKVWLIDWHVVGSGAQ